jgi:hypothetical protein
MTPKQLLQAVITLTSYGPRAASLSGAARQELDAAMDTLAKHGGRAVAEAFIGWHTAGCPRREPPNERPMNMIPPAGRPIGRRM